MIAACLFFGLFSACANAFSLPSCWKYHSQDCREFNLTSYQTEGIEDYMLIGNESNMPDAQVAADFHGIWYMDGNPMANELMSLANVTVDINDNSSYIRRMYEPKISTWDDTPKGKLLYEIVRTFGWTYHIKRLNESAYHIIPQFYTPTYLLGQQGTIGDFIAKFEIIRTEDPNIWMRPSSLLGKYKGAYRFTRIVNGDGSRTEYYTSRYIAKMKSAPVEGVKPLLTTQLIAAVDN